MSREYTETLERKTVDTFTVDLAEETELLKTLMSDKAGEVEMEKRVKPAQSRNAVSPPKKIYFNNSSFYL